MATLSPTGLQTATYGTTGWNNIYSTNFQMINDFFNRFNLSLNQVTFSSNITVDWSKSDSQIVTLTGNTTINFTNGRAGGKCILLIKQDATGGRVITWGSSVVNGFQPSTTANSLTAMIFVYDSVDSKYIGLGGGPTSIPIVNLSVSGDATGTVVFDESKDVTIPITLANSGVTAGTYGSATQVPVITFDSKGRATNITLASVASGGASSSISVTGADLTMSGSTGSDITNATLAPTGVTAGTYGDGATIPQITVDSKGRITSVTPVGVAGSSASSSISVTGSDLTMSGSTGANITNATLVNSGVTAGTYNNSNTQITPFTVDSKGRITAVGSLITITPAWASITSKPTTLAGYGITDGAPINNPTFTGTVTTPNLTITNTLTTSSGNVGIGTTSPNFKLDVIGIIASGYNVGNGEIRSYQSTDGVSYIALKTDATAHKSGIYRNAAGDFPFYYNTSTGDTSINVVWSGASIVFQIQGTEKMRIANGGNVGIGNTSPAELLDVSGNIKLSGALKCNLVASLAGTTAGTIQYSQYLQGQFKAIGMQAIGYENNTSNNQTITFPVSFANTPVIVTNTTGLTLSVSTTALTITAPNSTNTYSGIIEIKGF
jgi:hypothetical protein